VPRDAARAPPNVGRLVGALTPHPSFSGSKFEPLKRRCGIPLPDFLGPDRRSFASPERPRAGWV
jgi:hypothetical protein